LEAAVAVSARDLHEWIDTFRASMAAQLEEIHPSAQCICHEYFGEMHMAITAGEMPEFTRLLQLTQDKIADELCWEEEKRRSAADPRYVVRYFRG
jgi:hypothetical protein